ncbi:hypothetical protein BT63DRAFT_173454 [Microthyrium microscopicum]|uniref:Complex 1 LYR protein domain-containing protein n=1 Tax=Microthyrium microscopicum TaxID=703497 RepID=A0A6A6UKZ9_9PEZI|nr:hypothetical protein BT63DRAFT_173454 [Microthyrium microscopicum]
MSAIIQLFGSSTLEIHASLHSNSNSNQSANMATKLPAHMGKKVSAFQVLRRLQGNGEYTQEELRANALSLYRKIIRTIYRAPPSSVRDDTYRHARTEFERNKREYDSQRRAWLIKSGTNEYLMFGRYLDQQRFFVNPTRIQSFPEKRVAMLKRLLSVATGDKVQKIKEELKIAKEKVRRHEAGELVDGVAEGARELKRVGPASHSGVAALREASLGSMKGG